MGTLYKGGRPSMKMLVERAKNEGKKRKKSFNPEEYIEPDVVELNQQYNIEGFWCQAYCSATDVWDIGYNNLRDSKSWN